MVLPRKLRVNLLSGVRDIKISNPYPQQNKTKNYCEPQIKYAGIWHEKLITNKLFRIQSAWGDSFDSDIRQPHPAAGSLSLPNQAC
jgi:hypothetical protein